MANSKKMNRAADPTVTRARWIAKKTGEINPVFHNLPREHQRIVRALNRVKFTYTGSRAEVAKPSSQHAYYRLRHRLNAGRNVPATHAESLRLLYDDNAFPEYMIDALERRGWDPDKITDPTLATAARRLAGADPVKPDPRRGASASVSASAPASESASAPLAGYHDPNVDHDTGDEGHGHGSGYRLRRARAKLTRPSAADGSKRVKGVKGVKGVKKEESATKDEPAEEKESVGKDAWKQRGTDAKSIAKTWKNSGKDGTQAARKRKAAAEVIVLTDSDEPLRQCRRPAKRR